LLAFCTGDLAVGKFGMHLGTEALRTLTFIVPLPLRLVAGMFAAAVVFAFVLDLIKVPVFSRLEITCNPRNRQAPPRTQGERSARTHTGHSGRDSGG
jgi:hypothetical protein